MPECVRDSASSVAGLETSSFDVTYLEFLDQQIELNARGDEWSQRLSSRRCADAREAAGASYEEVAIQRRNAATSFVI